VTSEHQTEQPFRSKLEMEPERGPICSHSVGDIKVDLISIENKGSQTYYHVVRHWEESIIFSNSSERKSGSDTATFVQNGHNWVWLEKRIAAGIDTRRALDMVKTIYDSLKACNKLLSHEY
jgi:hypothetical protein